MLLWPVTRHKMAKIILWSNSICQSYFDSTQNRFKDLQPKSDSRDSANTTSSYTIDISDSATTTKCFIWDAYDESINS